MSVYEQILQKLQVLEPTHVQLANESMNHAGYFEGKESHFKLTVVSSTFEGLRRVARHQKVYGLVTNLMTSTGGSVHALAIHAYSPNEWQAMTAQNNVVPNSPQCAGKNSS